MDTWTPPTLNVHSVHISLPALCLLFCGALLGNKSRRHLIHKTKNPGYRRHKISQSLPIVALILKRTKTDKGKGKKLSYVTCPVSDYTCNMSHVTCPLSPVTNANCHSPHSPLPTPAPPLCMIGLFPKTQKTFQNVTNHENSKNPKMSIIMPI